MVKRINEFSSVPAFKQIRNHILYAIASGELGGGDRLPSILDLGKRLGVNTNTVAKAYRDLEVMELIFTRRGMGCFVKDTAQGTCKQNAHRTIMSSLFEVVQEAKATGMRKAELNQVVTKSLASKSVLYGDVPREVLSLAKK